MLHLNDLTYRIGERVLFEHTGFVLPDGAKAGLVGRNGSGKTTLFRIITGELASESGTIRIPKGCRVGYIEQETPAWNESVLATVLSADKERLSLIEEAETAEGNRRAEIEIRLNDINAHSAPARAASVLYGLGFSSEAQKRPCSSFSGGWRMRIALASILFTEPDILLLDEPTNYLDLEGTLWLNNYLARYPHTALVISHDREFLDTSVDHIIHLDQKKFTVYRGGYTSFARQYSEKKELLLKYKVKQEAHRKHLQSFIDRFRAKATKARQAQSRIKQLEKLEPVSLMVVEDVLPFDLKGPERPLSPPLMVLDNVAAGYGERVILKNITANIMPDDRIALLGTNGNGKSTFCKLLGGRLDPIGGEMVFSQKLKVAYFAQHQIEELAGAATPYEHVARHMPGSAPAQIRARVARFGFSGSRADTSVDALSGGEKARLLMGLAAFDNPDLLILDEPTNHLDIDSRSALMEAINDYTGAIILVSHDRFLVESCAEQLWLVADGRVLPFEGNMDDYRTYVLQKEKGEDGSERRSQNANGTSSLKETERKAAAQLRLSLAPLRKQRDNCELRMNRLSSAISKIDLALADGTAFQQDSQRAGELARKRAEAAVALADLEERWLELATQIDEISGRSN